MASSPDVTSSVSPTCQARTWVSRPLAWMPSDQRWFPPRSMTDGDAVPPWRSRHHGGWPRSVPRDPTPACPRCAPAGRRAHRPPVRTGTPRRRHRPRCVRARPASDRAGRSGSMAVTPAVVVAMTSRSSMVGGRTATVGPQSTGIRDGDARGTGDGAAGGDGDGSADAAASGDAPATAEDGGQQHHRGDAWRSHQRRVSSVHSALRNALARPQSTVAPPATRRSAGLPR